VYVTNKGRQGGRCALVVNTELSQSLSAVEMWWAFWSVHNALFTPEAIPVNEWLLSFRAVRL
jgi:hypothetical protein